MTQQAPRPRGRPRIHPRPVAENAQSPAPKIEQPAASSEDDVLVKAMAALQAAGVSLEDVSKALGQNDPIPAPTPEPISARPDPRPAMRADARAEDPRARAAKRAAQLREHGALDNDGVDNFALPPGTQPDGWEYEWKTRTVYGAENPAYQVKLAMAGWEPVPADRHPEMMPKDWRGQTIERDGLVLMERPKEICDDARARARRDALMQMRDKEAQITGTPQGQLERRGALSGGNAVRKSMEAGIPIPEA